MFHKFYFSACCALAATASFAQVPTNNQCTGAILLNTDTVIQGNNFNATSSGLPAACNDFPFFSWDVWYALEIDEVNTFSLLLTALSPDWDGVIKFYSGSCGALVELDCANKRGNGQFEYLQFFDLVPGTYYIRIYDYEEASSFQLAISEQVCLLGVPGANCDDGNPNTVNDKVTINCGCEGIPGLVNDEICGAIELSCGQTISGNYNLATNSMTDNCSSPGNKDVWYTFEADGEAYYFVSDAAAAHLNILEMFKADSCDGSLELIRPCENIVEHFGDQYPAGRYYVRIRGTFNTNQYSIRLTCTAPPQNDTPCSAEVFDCNSSNLIGNNFLAETHTTCRNNGAQTAGVWYTFTAAFDGRMRLNSCHNNSDITDFDASVSVFTGSCGALDCYAFSNGNFNCLGFNLIFEIYQGQQYYVLIAGDDEFEFGNFDVKINCTELVLDCPGLGNIGDSCDDGNPLTLDDVLTDECTCEGVLPQLGRVCEAPIMIESLPYTDAGNTSDYGDNYSGQNRPPLSPNVVVGEGSNWGSYLNGDDVVYAFTSPVNMKIDIVVTDPPETPLGLWVFRGCPFVETVAYATQITLNVTSSAIQTIPILAGENYYIVISSSPTFGQYQSLDYVLYVTAAETECPLIQGDVADPCDDGDITTINDVINTDCQCVGQPTSPGDICENPIVVNSLPYQNSISNGASYLDYYGNSDLPPLAPGADAKGGSPAGFLNGSEVVFGYTPTENANIVVSLPFVMLSGTSLFVFSGCPFAVTEGYDVTNTLDEISVSFHAQAETTYYFVVSGLSGAQVFDISVKSCNAQGGLLTSSLTSSLVCTGDNQSDVVQLTVEGNQGDKSIFGLVTASNDIVSGKKNGIFDLSELADGNYKLAHLSYAEGVSLNINNVSELQGCYDISNTISFEKITLAAGSIGPSGNQSVCVNNGNPALIDFQKSGATGPKSAWAVLNQNFSEIIDFGLSPDFDFNDYGSGIYRVVHCSYAGTLNPSTVDPLDLPACVSVSNQVTVEALDCPSAEMPLQAADRSPKSSLKVLANPVAIAAHVSFTLHEEAHATLEVFDLAGRRLELVFSSKASQGQEYQHVYNVSQLPNGIYLFRLRTESELLVEKFFVAH